MATAPMNKELEAAEMESPHPPPYTAVAPPEPPKSMHGPTAPLPYPTQMQTQGVPGTGQPMYNQPQVMAYGTQQISGTPGTCLHPNMFFNSTYDNCALACVIILIIEFFPWGLYALFCLNGIKRYRCVYCGHVQEQSKKCLYITFGILQVVFVILLILFVALRVRGLQTIQNQYSR